MSGNKKPYIEDPRDFNGNYVGAGDFEKPVTNEYDIRAFLKYKRKTGRDWKDLTASERNNFKF